MKESALNLNFTIGEVSKILDIPIDTLRYYDKIGLLHSRNRDANKYRYYDLEQFDALITIRMLRAMDVSIERIQALLRDNSLIAIRRLLSDKRQDIDRQRTYLKHLSRKLDVLDVQLQRFDNTEVIELVLSHPCWVLLTDSIMESGDHGLGSKVQQQVRRINAREWLAFCHTISIVSQDNLIAGRYHNYLYNGILSTFPMEGDSSVFQRLEPRYCARKCVVIGRDDYAKMDDHYDQMKAFIRNRGLKIAGDSLEVNLYNQYDHHYIEIYIPVEER